MRTKHPDFDKCTDKEVAFVHDGVEYWQFTKSGTPMYQERFVAFAMMLQKHNEYKVTEETLVEHETVGIETTKMLLGELYAMENGFKPFDFEIIRGGIELLSDNFNILVERRKLNYFPELQYELATLWYFDETESPYQYDADYNKVKKEKWLSSENREQLFFWLLRQPLSNFLNLEGLSPSSILTYTTQTALRELLHSMSLLRKAQQLGIESGMKKSIELQMETWGLLANLKNSALKDTITSSETE